MPDDSTTPKEPTAETPDDAARPDVDDAEDLQHADERAPMEHGGPRGLEPTRYGDWERNGRCYDF